MLPLFGSQVVGSASDSGGIVIILLLSGPPPPEEHHSSSGCHTSHGLFGPGETWPLDDGDPCGRAVCSRSLHGGHEVWEER